MAKKVERERRYLLLDFDKSALTDVPSHEIRQGYIQGPPNEVRVRTIDDSYACYTSKDGVGQDREEEEVEIPIEQARFLLRKLLYKVQKGRQKLDGNEIDTFRGVLEGIILLERESDDVTSDFQKPDYVKKWVDVTDSLSNYHLAHLAYEIERGFADINDVFAQALPGAVKPVVLTGGPCSGKSTAIEAIRNRFGSRVRCIPEVASVVMGLLDIRPPHPDRKSETVAFQRNLAGVQQMFEALSAAEAIQHGQDVIVLDRGVADNAAYLSFGGINMLAEILRMKPKQIYKRYHSVLHLAVPKRTVYEKHFANNPHRSETYEQAKTLGQRIADAWAEHPNYEYIKADDWETKLSAVMEHISSLLH